MSYLPKSNSLVVPESFGKSILLVRQLLFAAGLRVVKEFNLSNEPYLQLAGQSCVVLLVDTPVLLFEAIALDREAAVFIPIHILISGDREESYIHWANPVASSGLRAPVAARGAMENLYARVSEALSDLHQPAATLAGRRSQAWN